MKRILSMILAISLVLSIGLSSAFAEGYFDTVSMLAKGESRKSDTETKTTGNGVAAAGRVSGMTDGATFHFRVWKSTSWKASEGVKVTGERNFTMATLYDGNNNPRLWKTVDYYIVATHSSASGKTSAETWGFWHP